MLLSTLSRRSRDEYSATGAAAVPTLTSPSLSPATSSTASCAHVSLFNNDDVERTTDHHRRRTTSLPFERAPVVDTASVLMHSPPTYRRISNSSPTVGHFKSLPGAEKVTLSGNSLKFLPSIDMVSTINSTKGLTNGVSGCSECETVKDEVKALREQLQFLTHQIAALMRFLSVGCRCSTCETVLLASGMDWRTSGSTDLQNVNGYDQYLHSSYGQLFAAALRHQTQQDINFSRGGGGTAPDEESISPSSHSSSAGKSIPADSNAEETNVKVATKRSRNSPVQDDRMDTGVCGLWSKWSGDDDGCNPPKRRIVGVDELLPKLFPATGTNGQVDSNTGITLETSLASSKETVKSGRSSNDQSAEVDQTETPSVIANPYSLTVSDKIGKAAHENHLEHGRNRDFATPPAVLESTTKERVIFSFLQRPQPMLYPFGPYGMAGRKGELGTSVAVGCCSPPLRRMSGLECFKTVGGSADFVDRPRSLNDESPCSSNGGGCAEMQKGCTDPIGRNGFAAIYPPRNGLILSPSQLLPTTSIPSGTFHSDHHAKAFPSTGPPISAGLPLVTQGPRMSTFFCTICNRDFSNVYYKRHMIVHANARPYICDVCGKRFNERSNMMKHKQRLHGP